MRFVERPQVLARRPTSIDQAVAEQLAASDYARALLANFGSLRQRAWERRAVTSDTGVDRYRILDWWHEENVAWHLVHHVTKNYRDWRYRLRLLTEVRKLLAADSGPQPAERVAPWEDQLIKPQDNKDFNAVANRAAHLSRWLLSALESLVQAVGFDSQRDQDFENVNRFASQRITEVCPRAANAWKCMRNWLDMPANEEEQVDTPTYEEEQLDTPTYEEEQLDTPTYEEEQLFHRALRSLVDSWEHVSGHEAPLHRRIAARVTH